MDYIKLLECYVDAANVLNRIVDNTCTLCWRIVGHLDGEPIIHHCPTPTERRVHPRT